MVMRYILQLLLIGGRVLRQPQIRFQFQRTNDGGPVIFVWGNAANFAPLPIASILFIQEFEIDGGSPTLGLRIELGDWGRAPVFGTRTGTNYRW